MAHRVFGGVVAHILRVTFGWLRLGAVYAVWVVLALAAFAQWAEAVVCQSLYSSHSEFIANCRVRAESCANDTDCSFAWSSCTNAQATGTYPSCYTYEPSEVHGHSGFVGSCQSNGTEGPNIEWTGGSAGKPRPDSMCHSGCQLDVESPSPCTSVGPPINETHCLLNTTYTGQKCFGGSSQPPNEDDTDPANDPPSPEECSNSAAGSPLCVGPSDGDGNPSTPSGQDEPQVCIESLGVQTCRPVPTHPAASPGCSMASNGGGAVCTGGPGGSPPPPRPPAPYPANQGPDQSGQASSATASGQTVSTPYDAYGPPLDDDAGEPNENGECPGTTTNQGGVCRCPSGELWNGTQCVPGGDGDDNGEEEGEDRTATDGNCVTGPTCSGDQIDCVHLYQSWAVRCALTGTGEPPDISLASNPLTQYGGADALFYEAPSTSPGTMNESGLGWGAACPELEPIEFRGHSIAIPSVWCDLEWFAGLIMLVAYVIAARIAFGGD